MRLRLKEFQRIMDDHKFNREFITDNAAPCRHCGCTCAYYRMQVSWYPYEDVVQVFCDSCNTSDVFTVDCGIIPADAYAADVSKAHRAYFRIKGTNCPPETVACAPACVGSKTGQVTA